MIVLNVGGGASRHLPSNYDGWEQHLLDIDPNVGADVVHDAKHLSELPAKSYNAVYCSHNLEHFYWHEVPQVLAGFKHVLVDGGTVEIHVPNIKNLMQVIGSLDIQDVWYRLSDGTPVTYHDVLYGWNQAMANGNLFYSHKCGFTPLSLHGALHSAGFKNIKVIDQGSNLLARAEKG